jgi:hypothetical protein
MGLVHLLAAYAKGNLTGRQLGQRDFSPYVVHFTSWVAMAPLRKTLEGPQSVQRTAELLDEADARSWEVAKNVLASGKLLAKSPNPDHTLPPCVCFSECTLPGLMSHCERYGRFGFAFRKHDLYRTGGRPCLYLAEEEYGYIAALGRGKGPDSLAGRLFALSNVYVPPHSTNKVQDYTHEREWRSFADVELQAVDLAALLLPSAYLERAGALGSGVPLVPVDMLFDWGA